MKKIIISIVSITGLFIPIPKIEEKKLKWSYSISIGSIPLGWIIILVAYIVNICLK